MKTVSKALRRRERRAARRRRRMNLRWHIKDGRVWATAEFWPRGFAATYSWSDGVA